jgi:hypothetical protein
MTAVGLAPAQPIDTELEQPVLPLMVNWQCQMPLIVLPGFHYTLNGEHSASCIWVFGGGSLTIPSGSSLTLDGNTTSYVGGVVHIGAGQDPSVLRIRETHSVGGHGILIASGRNARIDIDEGRGLTSKILIAGKLHVGRTSGKGAGLAFFHNSDTVWANVDSGAIEFGPDVELADDENAMWVAGDDGVLSRLVFNRSATGLVGDFETLGNDSDSAVELVS